MQGWVIGNSINYDPKYNTVKFSVAGPRVWINYIKGFPTGIMDTDFADNGGGDPNFWYEMNNLTVAKGIWHFLHWRSTATQCIDIFLPVDDTRQAGQIQSSAGTLWDQLTALSLQVNLRSPCCDRYGRLWFVKNPNLVAVASRGEFTTVATLTRADYSKLSLEKRIIPDLYYAEVSGVAYSGGVGVPIGGKSPGDVPRFMGEGESSYSNIIMDSKANAIQLAGLLLGSGASDPENGSISLNSNISRLFDILPSYIRTTTAEKDTTLGIVYTAIDLIVKSVSHVFSEKGFLSTDLELEGEGIEMPGIEMTFPGEDDPEPEEPDEPEDPPEPPDEPPEPPDEPGDTNAVVIVADDVRTTEDLDEASPTWTTELA
jgi:hypothetical protein